MERQPSSSSSARVPSEGGTKSSRSSLTFISPSLFCFIIPSSLVLIFFPSKCISHSATPTQILFFLFCFCLVFCLLTFIFCKPTCFPLLSLSVFFSTSLCPTRLHPSPVSVTRTVSCSFTLSFFCYSSMSDHWHRNGTWGSADPRWYSPVVHVKAAVFPISPRVPVPPPFLSSPSVMLTVALPPCPAALPLHLPLSPIP